MIKCIKDMNKKEYIRYRRSHKDCLWIKYEKGLYISFKNENYAFYLILIEPILFILNYGIIYCITIFIIYIIICKKNNMELDLSQTVLNKRRNVIEYRIFNKKEFQNE
ncbi:hypothetical protein [Clostridium sp.]|uniref:hypothetical protein n=1 Tax=Clostridium sp. TaxID=1506 RepID=UPI0032172447